MAWLIIILYVASLLYIFLFSLSQLHLTWIYVRNNKKIESPKINTSEYPYVTVQLPIYNEKYVVERLLDAVCKFNYPPEKFEIQILDDSTDETTAIILKKIEALRPLSLDVKLIHRENRSGFKAGALDNGFHLAKGEFIAIFDADFIPAPGFLKETLPYFSNQNIGVVQTRWSHLNKDYSLLTQLQAFALDAHFTIEQGARNAEGSFINFNGTCGVWRKECIADAGGWKFDTLTEDLDLSYNAQLRGWKFKYIENIYTPGELPVIMQAIKSQQYRWNKGAAETARKIFKQVVTSKMSATHKLHAFFHLFNSSLFTSILIAALLSVPMLYIKKQHADLNWIFMLGKIFLFGFMSISIFYFVATKQFNKNPVQKFLTLFPPFLVISMGLSLHNGLAVLEGFLGIKTPFIRTPKFNIITRQDAWRNNTYIKPTINLLTISEGILCLYFILGIGIGVYLHDYTLMVFHSMLAVGFGVVFYYSAKSVTDV